MLVGGESGRRAAVPAILAFFLLLIYDGAVRKWLLPGIEKYIFVLKDILLLASLALVLWVRQRLPRPELPVTVGLPLALYAGWVVLEAGNWQLPGILVGTWGLKAYLLYGALLLLVPVAFEDGGQLLRGLEKAFPVLVIPVCILAFLQLASPSSSLLNSQLREDANAFFGEAGLVRVSGTFSYLSGMASFIQASSLLGAGLYFGGSRAKPFLVGLALVFAALPATGSRAVVVTFLAGTAVLLLTAWASGLMTRNALARTVLVLAALTAISFYTQGEAWDALAQRAAGSREDQGRAFTAFTNAFDYLDTAGLIGFGAGAANLGSPALADVPAFSWLPPGTTFEEESGRIVLELGLIGWCLGLLFRLSLVAWAMNLARMGRTRNARRLAVIAMPVLVLCAYQGSGVFAPPLWNAHVWLMVALLAVADRDHRGLARLSTATR